MKEANIMDEEKNSVPDKLPDEMEKELGNGLGDDE
jgi:hypothetical protein